VIPAISVDAPVNIRDVGVDGLLGVPTGGYDVVKYNFSYFPQLQGVIGGPGPTMVAGHFDYHVIGPAVFWDLALLKQNDVLEYWDGDVKFTYVVQWVAAVPYSEPLNAYLQGSDDALILITCFGTFDRSQFGGYDQRTIVYATPQ
jgi:sortase (surface protein transpeptidase)